jgi:hypothetical protein
MTPNTQDLDFIQEYVDAQYTSFLGAVQHQYQQIITSMGISRRGARGKNARSNAYTLAIRQVGYEYTGDADTFEVCFKKAGGERIREVLKEYRAARENSAKVPLPLAELAQKPLSNRQQRHGATKPRLDCKSGKLLPRASIIHGSPRVALMVDELTANLVSVPIGDTALFVFGTVQEMEEIKKLLPKVMKRLQWDAHAVYVDGANLYIERG